MTHFWKASDDVIFLAQVAVDQAAAGAYATPWISALTAHRFLAVVQVGGMAAGGTVDAKIRQATTAAGAGAKDVDGKAMTQLLAAGGGGKAALINFRPEHLDTNNDFAYVQLQIAVAVAECEIGGLLLGLDAPEQPAAHSAFVAEVIG